METLVQSYAEDTGTTSMEKLCPGGTDREGWRMTDDIGVHMLTKVEANAKSP